MKKLISGIVDFRKNILPTSRDKFSKLAAGQNPDVLFISCSDSRVAPNWFASTDPGDLFVVRNVGNMIPRCGSKTGGQVKDHSSGDVSELAAIEFAILNLKVPDIIVCGHSDCGAISAVHSGNLPIAAPHLQSWLKNGADSLEKFKDSGALDSNFSPVNQLSQINVLCQIEHLKSYEFIRERVEAGLLKIHGWWFDIAKADVYSYRPELNRFEIISAN